VQATERRRGGVAFAAALRLRGRFPSPPRRYRRRPDFLRGERAQRIIVNRAVFVEIFAGSSGRQLVQHAGPDPLSRPAAEAGVIRVPLAEMQRKAAPRRAGSHDPKNGFDEEAIVAAMAAGVALFAGKAVGDQRPACIGEIKIGQCNPLVAGAAIAAQTVCKKGLLPCWHLVKRDKMTQCGTGDRVEPAVELQRRPPNRVRRLGPGSLWRRLRRSRADTKPRRPERRPGNPRSAPQGGNHAAAIPFASDGKCPRARLAACSASLNRAR
jgi:hypothetical protein